MDGIQPGKINIASIHRIEVIPFDRQMVQHPDIVDDGYRQSGKKIPLKLG